MGCFQSKKLEEESHPDQQLEQKRSSTPFQPNDFSLFSPEFAPPTVHNVNEFELLEEIGHGSFGDVFRARKRDNGKFYAIKVLDKRRVVEFGMDLVERSKFEERIQVEAGLDDPFIVHVLYAFQSEEKLYIVLDYCAGGDLMTNLQRDKRFSEPRTKLYVAEIVLALEHLHALQVVYRDLKLENILLDAEGHVKLTDFGLAKELKVSYSTHTLCGTPEYYSPEMITGTNYGKGVDWWSLGVAIYVMLTGRYPFISPNRKELFDFILNQEPTYPDYISEEAQDLISGLLQKKSFERINTAKEVKSHPWFDGLDWESVKTLKIPPEYVPAAPQYNPEKIQTAVSGELVTIRPRVDTTPTLTAEKINTGTPNSVEGQAIAGLALQSPAAGAEAAEDFPDFDSAASPLVQGVQAGGSPGIGDLVLPPASIVAPVNGSSTPKTPRRGTNTSPQQAPRSPPHAAAKEANGNGANQV